MKGVPQIRISDALNRSTGDQQHDRIHEQLQFLNPQAVRALQQLAVTAVTSATIIRNPGPVTIQPGLWYGLDPDGNGYVLATGETAAMIQPLFVGASIIPPGATGAIIAPALPGELTPAPDVVRTVGAALWLSATAGREGTVTTTRPAGQTQFMVGWIANTILTPQGRLNAWILMQPKRT